MTHDDFLRAIIERPEDDRLRLVYADFLDERGEHGRAASIRVQIDLARLPPGDERRAELGAKERLAAYGQ
jgi:uncharacterized protein (TIGR02996 family)